MSVPHRLSGYDKRTGLLERAFDVPPGHDGEARAIARVPDSDSDAIGGYPLSADVAAAITALVRAPYEPARYDCFYEPEAADAQVASEQGEAAVPRPQPGGPCRERSAGVSGLASAQAPRKST